MHTKIEFRSIVTNVSYRYVPDMRVEYHKNNRFQHDGSKEIREINKISMKASVNRQQNPNKKNG